FVEQPRVFDGDDGLGGEVLQQFCLLLSERSHLLAIDDNCSNQVVFLEHRHGKYCPGTGELSEQHSGIAEWSVEIMRLVHDVCNLNRLFCCHHTSERRLGWGADQWIATSLLNECLRCTMHRNNPKSISFASIQSTELGLADASRILQHRLEHRLQLARRTTNDAQHLGRRRLLLKRLS